MSILIISDVISREFCKQAKRELTFLLQFCSSSSSWILKVYHLSAQWERRQTECRQSLPMRWSLVNSRSQMNSLQVSVNEKKKQFVSKKSKAKTSTSTPISQQTVKLISCNKIKLSLLLFYYHYMSIETKEIRPSPLSKFPLVLVFVLQKKLYRKAWPLVSNRKTKLLSLPLFSLNVYSTFIQ